MASGVPGYSDPPHSCGLNLLYIKHKTEISDTTEVMKKGRERRKK